MAKYKDLSWKYPLHFVRFTGMINRAKDFDLECDFKKVYDDFKKFIEIMGPVPANMDRPSVGRIDHSKGYVFDKENNKWNFRWQSMSENVGEAASRSKIGVKLSETHKEALSEAAIRKFQTTDAAQNHSNKMKEIWSTEEGRQRYTEALSTSDVVEKRSAKMKEHWSDENKKEQWKKSLSEGQKRAWSEGKYSNNGFKSRITCPVCGQEGNLAPMKRWHFDNCKQRSASV